MTKDVSILLEAFKCPLLWSHESMTPYLCFTTVGRLFDCRSTRTLLDYFISTGSWFLVWPSCSFGFWLLGTNIPVGRSGRHVGSTPYRLTKESSGTAAAMTVLCCWWQFMGSNKVAISCRLRSPFLGSLYTRRIWRKTSGWFCLPGQLGAFWHFFSGEVSLAGFTTENWAKRCFPR